MWSPIRRSRQSETSSRGQWPPARRGSAKSLSENWTQTKVKRRITRKKNEIPDTPGTRQRQALVEAISTAMSKGLEPLLAVKESKNKPTKYRGTREGNADGWMILMKRHLEKAHAKATPLDEPWTIIEYLEQEAKEYITNKSQAERDTDEKVFALLARGLGMGSNKIHIQLQFRSRKQNSEEDYMQYLGALEGLRSQGYPNEEVTVRRYAVMERFIEGVRNLKHSS